MVLDWVYMYSQNVRSNNISGADKNVRSNDIGWDGSDDNILRAVRRAYHESGVEKLKIANRHDLKSEFQNTNAAFRMLLQSGVTSESMRKN